MRRRLSNAKVLYYTYIMVYLHQMHISIVAGTPASLPSTETTPIISKTTQGMIKVSIK